MAAFFIETQLEALAREQGTSVRSLKATIAEVAEDLHVATACSGTDSPFVLAKYWGLNSLFSCEYDEKKQKWILENFPETPRLFHDIKTLKRDEVLNMVTGRKERVPSADIFITGFVCKSVSTENNDRKVFKNCIHEASGETGETFSGMMTYVRKHQPMVVIAENVAGITKHNDGQEPVINHVADSMSRAGYHFGYKLLNANQFMIPQNRDRCWMVGLRKERFQEDDVADIFHMIDRMKTKRPMGLRRYFGHFKVGQAGMPENSRLNPRQRNVIKAALKKVAKKRNPRDQVIIDAAKSEQRCPVQLNKTPCLVANSAMYWHNEARFLSAQEVLALQGIFPEDFPAEHSFLEKNRRLCHDLTGNAFSMSVCSAVLNAVMLKLAEA